MYNLLKFISKIRCVCRSKNYPRAPSFTPLWKPFTFEVATKGNLTQYESRYDIVLHYRYTKLNCIRSFSIHRSLFSIPFPRLNASSFMLKAIPSMSFVLSPSIAFHPLLQIYRALIITCIGCSTFSTALPEQPSLNWKVNAETFMWPRKHHRTPSLGLSRRSFTGTSSMQFNCHCMDADLHLPCIMGRINKFKLMNQAPDRSASASRIDVDAHHI